MHVLTDGKSILMLPDSMDYKQVGKGDQPPNTGGMGAHSPSKAIDLDMEARILREVVEPTFRGIQKEDLDYRGVLYIGLMLTEDGPKVLEYNCRFGDPECQALMLRLGENDLLPLLYACAKGDLSGCCIDANKMHKAAACIVLTSKPYPDEPVKGEVITGIEKAEKHKNATVFHAETKLENGQILSDGGRVLNICSVGDTLEQAIGRAYDASFEISWPSKYMRKDIGFRVL